MFLQIIISFILTLILLFIIGLVIFYTLPKFSLNFSSDYSGAVENKPVSFDVNEDGKTMFVINSSFQIIDKDDNILLSDDVTKQLNNIIKNTRKYKITLDRGVPLYPHSFYNSIFEYRSYDDFKNDPYVITKESVKTVVKFVKLHIQFLYLYQ